MTDFLSHRYVSSAVARSPYLDAERKSKILDRRDAHVWMRLETERQDWDDDEEHGQRRDDLSHTTHRNRIKMSISKRFLLVGQAPLFLPFLSVSSLLSFPSLISLSLPFRPCPLEVASRNPAKGSWERCKLPQRGLGRSPSRNRIWCILASKYAIWWQQFQWFS